MIKLHPKGSLLSSFVEGSLPASLSIVIASHVEMCPLCQQEIEHLTEQAANVYFGHVPLKPMVGGDAGFIDGDINMMHVDDELDSEQLMMLKAITETLPDDVQHNTSIAKEKEIEVSGVKFTLPRALQSVERKSFQGLGKLSRSRLTIEDGNLRTSLLYIDKGGCVPTHTHKGFEVTLLLQGCFEDEMGTYHEGDFIWLDGEHTHQPVTKTGCICLTVSSDAIHFTQGVSQLLNPIGQFIY
ncbi:cupin domain-containing protein [Shewanella sp. VB17]|uniref:ChrR family anti-sigma-E factor n=1 Tax=Shewanella sp. VB17 TaxID=2739432 RepID=UPI0015675338|nr:ChrR family anti-sigma-E factor [Shewanella sp. VB17]NRD74266.1 cupin domain-containing protein [Shewanella sp. VB17]